MEPGLGTLDPGPVKVRQMGVVMKSIGTLKQSRGAVAPLVAIMLILIVVCIALVVDLGHIHNVKVELQRAVDAAALAGAQQLSGGIGAGINARAVAVATALANTVDQGQVVIDPDAIVNPNFKGQSIVAVQPINWNPNIVDPDTGNTLTTSERITPITDSTLYSTANGLWVTAQRDVNHIFFFFVGSTQVTADAIAVATPEVPILPLAIVTCIPAEKMLENPGSLPDMTVCGITAYSFDPDREDTAAWSSLTFGANAADIAEFMETTEGRDKFNKVVFGTGLANTRGLENESIYPGALSYNPDDIDACYPRDFNITCGLGQIAGKDIATPAEFPAPTPLPNLTQITGVYQANLPFDPLTAYGNNGVLPRWYNLNASDEDFDNLDHFTRVWSQDGILLKGTGETYAAYVSRMASYADCTDVTVSSCNPYGDNRFKIIGNNENLIVEPKGQFRNNLNAAIGFNPSHWPDFLKVVRHAGYPKVGVINGNTANVLSAFINNPMVTDGTKLRCSDNDPFPTGEKTLRVNAPVIFAGSCENWKAISNPSDQDLRYIGLSKVLVTRVWVRNNESYDCGEESEVVRLHGDEVCNASGFDPGLVSNTYFSLPVSVNSSLKAIEGLTLVPVADDEENQGSLLKIFLVE